jgi:hypothetical protein
VLRAAGVALVAVMAIHVAVRPEHAWILLSACDLAAVATALGLVASWPRVVAIAFVFELALGLPAFAIGLCTTYPLNPTGTIIHLAPPILGAIVIARYGIPRRAAAVAWCGYACAIVAGAAFAPAELNVNFAASVWPPLADTLSLRAFQAGLLAVAAVLLVATELAARGVLSWRRGRAPTRPRDTAR